MISRSSAAYSGRHAASDAKAWALDHLYLDGAGMVPSCPRGSARTKEDH